MAKDELHGGVAIVPIVGKTRLDGEVGSGWKEITNYLDSVGQDYTVTSTVRPGAITSSGNLSNQLMTMAT